MAQVSRKTDLQRGTAKGGSLIAQRQVTRLDGLRSTLIGGLHQKITEGVAGRFKGAVLGYGDA